MGHVSDCGADSAAYALGALDAMELDAFERHLATCSICQTEVESLRQTVSALPMAAPQYPASKELRRRVIRSVQADIQFQRQAVTEGEARRPLSAGRGSVPRFAPGRGFRPGLVYGIAALILVLAVVIAGITAAGGAKKGPQVVSASTGSGEVIVRSHSGELIVRKLPRLSDGQVYEVWLEKAGGSPQPTSTLFNTDSTGHGDVTVNGSLKGYAKVLVTREPAGGTARPTTKPVVGVDVG